MKTATAGQYAEIASDSVADLAKHLSGGNWIGICWTKQHIGRRHNRFLSPLQSAILCQLIYTLLCLTRDPAANVVANERQSSEAIGSQQPPGYCTVIISRPFVGSETKKFKNRRVMRRTSRTVKRLVEFSLLAELANENQLRHRRCHRP
jgi:hypothetical protein